MARSKTRLLAPKTPPAALLEGAMDTLTQGISQQPAHLRVPGQGEEQLNGWSSPVSGLTKRRPTRFVAKISSTPLTDFYMEMMPVQTGERYSVMAYRDDAFPSILDQMRLEIISNGTPCYVDVHGAGLSKVTAPSGRQVIKGTDTSYLATTKPVSDSFVFINSGPLGLLLNRNALTALDAATTPAQKKEALLFVQGVAYEVTYTITLNGTVLPVYTTPKATDTNNQLSTDTVASELKNRISAVAGFTATRVGSVVHVTRADGADFTLNLADGRAGTLARSFKSEVAAFTGLPTVAPNGFLLRVAGNPDSATDDYWVAFRTRDGAAFGDGSWQEAPAPGVPFKLNPETMPLVIYRSAPGVLFVGPADGATRSQTVNGKSYSYTFPAWGRRTAGSAASLPDPSFVGKAIRDHALFRSRYVVVAGESVVLSEVDDVFNFYGDTSSQVLDTDPIDLRAVSEISSELQWILAVDESLLVFSRKSQFQVRPADADVLTPRTAVCLRLSNIEMNEYLRPKLAGPNVMFATNEYGYTGLREYQFFDTQQRRLGINLGGSLNVTINVPKLIKGMATRWDVGETLDYLVCVTPDDLKRVYVYKYLWQSGQGSVYKQQSSWSEWTLGGDVRWLKFMDNQLWMVLTYPDGTYTSLIEPEELDDEANPMVYLDRLILYPECNADIQATNNILATYSADTNRTTFRLPYQMQGETVAVVRFTNGDSRGLVLATATGAGPVVTDNVIECTTPGDWTTAKVAIGASYLFRYTFTNAYKPARDQARQRVIGDLNGRLQVATWTVQHFATGRYDVIVERRNRSNPSRHQFWSRFLNVASNRLDSAESLLDTGSFRVPVHSRNTDCRVTIESDSWLPLTITGASWEGSYSDRARSIS